MKPWLLWLLTGLAFVPIQAKPTPQPLIFDTDMDSDVDDVAALCQLHAMADAGEIDLLGVAISGRQEWSAPCVDAINTFYGRPDLPIALVSGTRGIHQPSRFARQIAEAFPQDYQQKHAKFHAVELYRSLLSKAADKSVIIVSVGDMTNLAALLSSPADGISPLTGKDLISAKVKNYTCMGSRYPADEDPGKGRWGNFRTDPVSTKEVTQSWPTLITFTGGGKFAESMAIGKKITELDPAVWPVSLGYRSYFGKQWQGKTRHTADSIAVLVAVRGVEPHFKLETEGFNIIDDVGRNRWVKEPNQPNHQYTSALNNPREASKLAALMEELAMQTPKNGLPMP